MLKIFISSHGHLATGIKSSLDILMGNTDMLTCYDAYVDDSDLENELTEFFKGIEPEDTVVMLSDLFGGSVNSVMYRFLIRKNTYLVAGVNLAFVLELMTKENIEKAELEKIIQNARESLRIVELFSSNQTDERREEND